MKRADNYNDCPIAQDIWGHSENDRLLCEWAWVYDCTDGRILLTSYERHIKRKPCMIR